MPTIDPGTARLKAITAPGRSWLIIFTLALMITGAGGAHGEFAVARGSAGGGADPASAGPGQLEWPYTLRAGDSFDAVARTLLSGNINPRRLAGYNGFTDTGALRAGTEIRIPLAWLRRQPAPASAASVSGQVQIKRAGSGQTHQLSTGDRVSVGDTVVTRQGSATIELADNSVIRVSPGSRLRFNRLTRYGNGGMVDTRARLEDGEVSTRVKPVMDGDTRFEIETPSALAAVRGTAFTLQTDRGGSRLQVTEGSVDFGPPGRSRRIPAGYGARVESGSSAPMRIRALPPRPVLDPLPGALDRLPVDFRWGANGARRYQIDIIDADNGAWISREETTDNALSLTDLDNGRYNLQVAALDANGIAGMPATTTIDVALAASAAQLTAPADGSRIDQEMPEFTWTFTGDNESGRVEIATDADFAGVVATSDWSDTPSAVPSRPLNAGQYHWRVVTEAGGNSVATSTSRILTINGTLAPVRIISANYIDRQVRVYWESLDSADGYQLQLSEDPAFERIVKEAEVDDTTAALRLIPGRRYFVRLKALSDGPLAGRWGPGRELFIE